MIKYQNYLNIFLVIIALFAISCKKKAEEIVNKNLEKNLEVYTTVGKSSTKDMAVYDTTISSNPLTLNWYLNKESVQRVKLLGCLRVDVDGSANELAQVEETYEGAGCKVLGIIDCSADSNCKIKDKKIPFNYKYNWIVESGSNYVSYTFSATEDAGLWSLLADPEVLALNSWAGFWVRIELENGISGKWVRIDP